MGRNLGNLRLKWAQLRLHGPGCRAEGVRPIPVATARRSYRHHPRTRDRPAGNVAFPGRVPPRIAGGAPRTEAGSRNVAPNCRSRRGGLLGPATGIPKANWSARGESPRSEVSVVRPSRLEATGRRHKDHQPQAGRCSNPSCHKELRSVGDWCCRDCRGCHARAGRGSLRGLQASATPESLVARQHCSRPIPNSKFSSSDGAGHDREAAIRKKRARKSTLTWRSNRDRRASHRVGWPGRRLRPPAKGIEPAGDSRLFAAGSNRQRGRWGITHRVRPRAETRGRLGLPRAEDKRHGARPADVWGR